MNRQAAASAGYSGKPLIQKLGIRAGFRACVENAPDHYESLLGPWPEGVEVMPEGAADLDFLQYFTRSRDELEAWFDSARERIKQGGKIWISWPKQSSPLRGELDENDVREVGLASGLVDVKVAAIDADWSGLMFVIRREDRRS